MAKRVSNWDARMMIAERVPFTNSTGSFRGEVHATYRAEHDEAGRLQVIETGQVYRVMSYGTCLAEYVGGVWWINDTSYSVTTAKHQGTLRWAINARTYSGDDNLVHVIRVPRGTQSGLERFAGAVAHQRAARLARAA